MNPFAEFADRAAATATADEEDTKNPFAEFADRAAATAAEEEEEGLRLKTTTNITVEELLVFLQTLVAKRPDTASWSVKHVEFGALNDTNIITAEAGMLVVE